VRTEFSHTSYGLMSCSWPKPFEESQSKLSGAFIGVSAERLIYLGAPRVNRIQSHFLWPHENADGLILRFR